MRGLRHGSGADESRAASVVMAGSGLRGTERTWCCEGPGVGYGQRARALWEGWKCCLSALRATSGDDRHIPEGHSAGEESHDVGSTSWVWGPQVTMVVM